ncbi:sensor domain-containing protein [Mycolicibacterium smegmatis]|uniref:sensor domain-containing protein n=1 Tax=Mycolicibacterium smegmatis TaxID=1772 RepID=UPI001EFA743C|nr:sensor domain-containing protein [Mycolicibacterium smegmatis]ULN27056.1 sensor domain-containing protein [Mycolicibacterium smegmatis]
MTPGRRWTRLCTACAAAAVMCLLSGCVTVVGGTATRDPAAPPPGAAVTEVDLDNLLLPVTELGDIVGSDDLTVTVELDQFNDSSAAMDDPDCLAAAFGAQERVYAGTGWTAVRDQIVREPGSFSPHWIEQVVVLFTSDLHARDFFDQSRETWRGCVGTLTTYDIDQMPLEWVVGEVTAEESTISQLSVPETAVRGGCHHALSVAANLVAEAWACGEGVEDQASEIVDQIVANIE